MSKLTLDALKQRADATATDELLGQISGGMANDCHTGFWEGVWGGIKDGFMDYGGQD